MRNKKVQSAQDAPNQNQPIYLALSFLFPFIILGVMFALHQVYPFGNRQILVTDFWQQYYPFLSDYWHKLREGSSLLWSWTGTGNNYLGIISYYLASPLNLLATLFPHDWLREVLVAVLLVKVGCAGLFFALYLRYTHRRCDLSVAVFSVFYALCAFALGYYWNIMWMDTFALLPLVMLGTQAIVREGRYRVYIMALALSVFINYYIGLFTCIFTAVMFFVHCFVHRLGWRAFFGKLGKMVLYSAIGLGITALLTVPAFLSLQNSSSAVNKFPTSLKLYESFGDIFANMIAFTPPTSIEGLPNVYSGMVCVLLAAVFIRSPKVSKREKFAYVGVLAFLVLSCNLNVLNFIWHGFHFTNMIPYRFAFLLSFTLVVMAYRAYTLLEDMNRKDVLAMAVAAAVFLALAVIGPQETGYIIANAALCAVYLLLFLLIVQKREDVPSEKDARKRRVATALLFVIMLAEASVTAYIGVETVSTSDRTSYPTQYAKIRRLLDMRASDDPAFFRTEFTKWYSVNDPSLYGYKGIALFASPVNVRTTNFMLGLGLPGGDTANRYYYAETSPLTNAFLNVRYLVCRDGNPADNGVYWEKVGEVENGCLLENKRYLPMGFMVDGEAAAYKGNKDNPFDAQNDLFKRATGLEGELFSLVDVREDAHLNYSVERQEPGQYRYTVDDASGEGGLQWNYMAPEDGPLYVYCKVDNAKNIRVSVKGNTLRTMEIKKPLLFCAGTFEKGELVSFTADLEAEKGNARIYVSRINQDLFDEGYALLADETLQLTSFSDTAMEGSITALRDGLLYTSIPYEKGWTAYVDGEARGIVPVDGGMAAIWLEEGTHTVAFRFRNEGLHAGMFISLVSLAAFAALMLLDKYKNGKPTGSAK